MANQSLAAMQLELAALKKQLANVAIINAQPAPKAAKPARAPKAQKAARIAGDEKQFEVLPDVEKSAQYGIDYCIVRFLGCESASDMSDVQISGKQALKAARWGANGRGKFHWNANLKAWTGQSAYVPSFIISHS